MIAYVADAGVGVLDPATGKSTIVAPLPRGAFRVTGPVWAPAPNLNHPVLYFTLHDDRTPERRNTAGVVPYNWIFRVDPFVGSIEAIAASQDSMSEGPGGPVAICDDGPMVAVALPSPGAVIEPINSGLPIASPSASASSSGSAPAPATPTAKTSPKASPPAPKKINSKLLHPDGLSWSPDPKQLA